MHSVEISVHPKLSGDFFFLCLVCVCVHVDVTVCIGDLLFVRWKAGVWCRTQVIDLYQVRGVETVRQCVAADISKLKVFFLDYGFTKGITVTRCVFVCVCVTEFLFIRYSILAYIM